MTHVGTITNVLECLLEQLEIGQSLSIDMGNAVSVVVKNCETFLAEFAQITKRYPNMNRVTRLNW